MYILSWVAGSNMKGIKKNKAHKTNKHLPGCLGRMVNLFDLTAGVSANRLLMNKPHFAGMTFPFLLFLIDYNVSFILFKVFNKTSVA